MKKDIEKYMKELGIKNSKNIDKKIKEIENTEYKTIEFTIIGKPAQTHRPRFTSSGHFYVPNAAKNKKFIRKQIKEQVDIKSMDIISGEIKIEMSFYVEIPTSFSKTDKVLAEMGYIKPTTTPDIDNYMKTYMDAITGVLWLDDGQVIESKAYKYYSKNPRVECKLLYNNDLHCSVLKNYAKNKQKNFDLGL